MRILHVIRSLDFDEGGPPVIATRLAAAQAAAGHSVSIACYDWSRDPAETRQLLSHVPHWEKVSAHFFPRPSYLEQLLGTVAAQRLTPLVAKADVLHLHNVWDPLLRHAATTAHATNKPFLVMLNGMLDPWSLGQKRLKKRLALALCYRQMLNRAAFLHVGNPLERDLIAPLGLEAPVAILPNGVTLEEIDPLPVPGTFIAAHPALAGRRYILFLSRLHHKKGLDYLAAAFASIAARNPDVDLVVGGPDGGAREPFVAQIAASGLQSRVHMVGRLFGRDKWAAFVDCDLFTLPSRQEGFSVAILEALAAAKPVVISKGCHFDEVAGAGAGEVVELNVHQMAGALERTLNREDRAAVGRAGRALVESRYTWRIAAEQSLALYEQAIQSRTPAGGSRARYIKCAV